MGAGLRHPLRRPARAGAAPHTNSVELGGEARRPSDPATIWSDLRRHSDPSCGVCGVPDRGVGLTRGAPHTRSGLRVFRVPGGLPGVTPDGDGGRGWMAAGDPAGGLCSSLRRPGALPAQRPAVVPCGAILQINTSHQTRGTQQRSPGCCSLWPHVCAVPGHEMESQGAAVHTEAGVGLCTEATAPHGAPVRACREGALSGGLFPTCPLPRAGGSVGPVAAEVLRVRTQTHGGKSRRCFARRRAAALWAAGPRSPGSVGEPLTGLLPATGRAPQVPVLHAVHLPALSALSPGLPVRQTRKTCSVGGTPRGHSRSAGRLGVAALRFASVAPTPLWVHAWTWPPGHRHDSEL